jgi:leukotriene-A4 hydrolase
MATSRLALAVLAFALLTGARGRAVGPTPLAPPLEGLPEDVYSWSEPADVQVRHVELDLNVSFETRTLAGTAHLDIHNLRGTSTLVLDTESLSIERITLNSGEPTLWSVGDATPFGAPLTVAIKPDTHRVSITYRTSAEASGLLWNTAEQTLGRTHPYLYTQNEPIAARSWIPIQDTPGVRMTYAATVRVPPDVMALMSASNPKERNDSGIYRFVMDQPVPAYLISMAVARLEYRELASGIGVYAEPVLIEDAARELHYVPRMMEIAESIAGPYPWGQYDLLMMPPTYIIGGMEHPRLNFINPSIITRNRSVDPVPSTLIAHELAHSWSGDLATLATWADVWLNEGITSYLEVRIIEELSGPRRAEYEWFNDRRGFQNLVNNLDDDLSSTILHRPTGHFIHPGSFFNSAAYTKGGLFFKTLEDTAGRQRLDAFLQLYFETFRFRWVDDLHFLDLLRESLNPPVDVEQWIYGAGLPSSVTAPGSSQLFNQVLAEANGFLGGQSIDAPSSWTAIEIDLFIALIGSAAHGRMSEVDGRFGLSSLPTPPVNWLIASIRANYSPGLAAVERILMRGGPNGWIMTLYAELAETPAGLALALSVFERAAMRYHDGVRSQVELILGLSSSALVRQEAVGEGVSLVRFEMFGVDQLPFVDIVELGEKRVPLRLAV